MPRPNLLAPRPLAAADRRRMEIHHRRRPPRLFVDNLPWADPGFARRFVELTDVRHTYWGGPEKDVDRIEAILEAVGTENPHVVDLCCGAGRHAIELARRGIRVTGLDVSDYAIHRARGKAAARKLAAKFLCADVSAPPPTEPAHVAAILCEQIVNFSPDSARALIESWASRIVEGGAIAVEIPLDIAPYADELYWSAEPLFFETPGWVRYTQDPDPIERTLLETFTCLEKPGAAPVSFFNSRKYYTPREIADLAPGFHAQVIDILPADPRPALQWVVLRQGPFRGDA